MQAAATQMRRGGLVGLDIEVGHVGEEVAGLGVQVAPLLRLLVGQERLQGHVEADHGGRRAGTEQVVRGVRILGDVRLHAAVHVAAHRQGAAHEHDLANLILDLGGLADGCGDVGHRAGRHVDEVLAVGLDRVDDEVDGGFGFGLARGVGDVHVSDAVVAVDELGDLQDLEAVRGFRMRDTFIYLDLGVAEQFGDGQRVAHTLLQQHVAVGAGDADELDLGTAQRVGDGEGVIDTGVQIENELCHGVPSCW